MPTPAPRPRKRLGQHFLVDHNIVRKIVALTGLRSDDTVLEIGPGRGILTRALCQAAGTVIAVELDRTLGDHLAATLADCRNLDLRIGDALAFSYDTLPRGTVVAANLPYYISTPLLMKLLESHERITHMVVMLQTEVARRLVARPGTKDYGILSVLTQYRATPALAFHVSPNCFRPRPAVGSSVVRLTMRTQRAVPVRDEALLITTVRAAFAHRRKTLVNSLRDEGFSQDQVVAALAMAGIAPAQRAEQLPLETFAALADALHQTGAGKVARSL